MADRTKAPEADISAEFPFKLSYADVFDSSMAYIDTGSTGDTATAVFLHGNPTSSYIWRNIIPHVSPERRCVAPDLIGMGKSGKLDIAYRFVDHVHYLDAFLDAVVPAGKLILVLQDWGSALGLHWASRHVERIAGLALMEFIRPFATWDDAGKGEVQEIFRQFRDSSVGRKLIIEDNMFLKAMLPGGVVRGLSAEEQAYYDAPFPDTKTREPVYRWPNEIPIEGHPIDVHAFATEYHDWLVQSQVPKMIFWAKPGAFVREEHVELYKKSLSNLETVFLGEGVHYLQEDHPHRIGEEIASFAKRLNTMS